MHNCSKEKKVLPQEGGEKRMIGLKLTLKL